MKINTGEKKYMYISHKASWKYWLGENKLFKRRKTKAIGSVLNNKSQLG